jgi:1-acyl-sn-glycerol-3-phosphate acyltransferase
MVGQTGNEEPGDANLTGPHLAKKGSFFEGGSSLVTRVLCRTLWGCRWRGGSTFPRTGPVLLISNHPSYIDPPSIYVGIERRVFWMAWRGLFQVPGLKWFLEKAGAFSVDDLSTDTRAMRTAGRILKAGHVVGIFPEGGRSLPSGEMLPFLTSPFRFAIRLQCPVVPVTMNGTGRIWPRGRILPAMGKTMEILYHPALPPPTSVAGGSKGISARAAHLARKTREIILSRYRAPEPVLALSRREWALDPAEHPMVQANRAGISVVDWVEGGHWKK